MVGGSRLCSRESNQLVEGGNLGPSKHWLGYSGHILQLETLFLVGLNSLMRTIDWGFHDNENRSVRGFDDFVLRANLH